MGIWCQLFHKNYWSLLSIHAFKRDWNDGKTAELRCIHCSVRGRIGCDPEITY